MLYFAYGSDLNSEAMLDWGQANGRFIPPRSTPQPAILQNHRLCFPAYDPFWRGGVADVASEPGKSVSGALYEVSDTALSVLDQMADRRLDRHGRETGTRVRSRVNVNLFNGGKTVEAYAYQLRQYEHIHVPPADSYLERLVDAAWRLGLSTMWLMHLRSFSTQTSRPAVTFPVLRPRPLRLTEIDIDQDWPRLRNPHAIIQANRIRPACDRAVGGVATESLCAV